MENTSAVAIGDPKTFGEQIIPREFREFYSCQSIAWYNGEHKFIGIENLISSKENYHNTPDIISGWVAISIGLSNPRPL